jgi:hypothetical protein
MPEVGDAGAACANTSTLPNKKVSKKSKPIVGVLIANLDESNFMLACFEINYLSGIFSNSSMCSFRAKKRYTKRRAKNVTKMISDIMGNIETPDMLCR